MEQQQSIKKQTVNGALWRVAETGGMQLIQLAVSIVLARLIMPSQFGAIAMLQIFLVISQTFIDSGFSSALIRKSDRTQTDCSTVFYFNIGISIIAYGVLFVCAPLIARFFDMAILTPVLRVSALSLIIAGVTSVQTTLYTANMNFKALAKFNIIGAVASGVVGITMAYMDFQIWALVAQTLTNTAVNSVCLWAKSTWRPTWEFSMQSFRSFFGFGSKLLASRLLDVTYENIYGVVIGKVFHAADLAFYNRAGVMKNMTSMVPTNVLQSVTFPSLCKLQDNDDKLRDGYRRILRLCAYVIFPLCLGVGAVSFPLINILYSDKWIYSATLLQIIVFAGMWYPIHAINLNLLTVKGRSDLFFRLEIIKKVIGVTILCITVPIGLEAMCYGSIFSSIAGLLVNTHYTGKLLNMGFWTQMKDYLPFLLLSLAMFVVCKVLTTALGNGWLSLLSGIVVGVAIYGGGSLLFKLPELKELKNLKK